MTLAVFLFLNLPQNIVCSGEWLPPRVCVTVFLTERESMKKMRGQLEGEDRNREREKQEV